MTFRQTQFPGSVADSRADRLAPLLKFQDRAENRCAVFRKTLVDHAGPLLPLASIYPQIRPYGNKGYSIAISGTIRKLRVQIVIEIVGKFQARF